MKKEKLTRTLVANPSKRKYTKRKPKIATQQEVHNGVDITYPEWKEAAYKGMIQTPLQERTTMDQLLINLATAEQALSDHKDFLIKELGKC